MTDIDHQIGSISEELREALYQDFLARLALTMTSAVDSGGHPRTGSIPEFLRNLPALQWNSKVLGSHLASTLYDATARFIPRRHDSFTVGWRATRFQDFEQQWFLDACRGLQIAPVLHRKIWEDIFVVNSIHAAGKLRAGCRGICFGVGEERLPSYFASMGAKILATDLAPTSEGASGWISTAQHGSLEKIFHSNLVDRKDFDRLVEFDHADMNNIPASFDGQFDFCWSVCAFEHLGSIEKGLKFVERTGQLLRPGGISVHTTEFNFSHETDTIDNWGTVLYRKRDFTELANRLLNRGYIVPAIDFDVGSSPVDRFLDVPPYPGQGGYLDPSLDALHLKLLVDGFPTTCFGVAFQRAE